MILEKLESSILNGLGYIVHLEKKSWNKSEAAPAPAAEYSRESETRLFPLIKI